MKKKTDQGRWKGQAAALAVGKTTIQTTKKKNLKKKTPGGGERHMMGTSAKRKPPMQGKPVPSPCKDRAIKEKKKTGGGGR